MRRQPARLEYRLMSEAFLEATVRADRRAAHAACGLTLPDAWFAQRSFAAMRLEQLRTDPAYAPWGPRIISLRDGNEMIGRIGFHSAPGPGYLESLAPWPVGRGAVEFGYTIFPEHAGNGYATEASIALMRWARETHAVRRFVLSISPENPASLRIADKLGFVRVGEHIDPEDGLEYVFVYPAPAGR